MIACQFCHVPLDLQKSARVSWDRNNLVLVAICGECGSEHHYAFAVVVVEFHAPRFIKAVRSHGWEPT